MQNDGSTLFVVAGKELYSKRYNERNESVTWENCFLRSWLNEDFYNIAFSCSEQGAIVEQIVVNENNPEYGTEGGNDTLDKVFLLSIEEVTDPAYGFCEEGDTYSASRFMEISDYDYVGGQGEMWWLRSSGVVTIFASVVKGVGSVNQNGFRVDFGCYGMAPALHINLSSDLWLMEDDGSSGEGGGSGSTLPDTPDCTHIQN